MDPFASRISSASSSFLCDAMSLFVHKKLCAVENVEFAPGLMTLEILRQDRNFKFTQPLLLSTHNVDDPNEKHNGFCVGKLPLSICYSESMECLFANFKTKHQK